MTRNGIFQKSEGPWHLSELRFWKKNLKIQNVFPEHLIQLSKNTIKQQPQLPQKPRAGPRRGTTSEVGHMAVWKHDPCLVGVITFFFYYATSEEKIKLRIRKHISRRVSKKKDLVKRMLWIIDLMKLRDAVCLERFFLILPRTPAAAARMEELHESRNHLSQAAHVKFAAWEDLITRVKICSCVLSGIVDETWGKRLWYSLIKLKEKKGKKLDLFSLLSSQNRWNLFRMIITWFWNQQTETDSTSCWFGVKAGPSKPKKNQRII